MHQRLSYYEKMVINNWQNTYSAWPLIMFSQSYRLCLDYPRSRFCCYICTRGGCSMRIVMLDFLFVLVENDWYRHLANVRTKFLVCCNEGEVNLCAWVVTEVLHIRPLVPNRKSVPTKSLHRRKGSFEVSWSMAFSTKKRFCSLKIPP